MLVSNNDYVRLNMWWRRLCHGFYNVANAADLCCFLLYFYVDVVSAVIIH